MIKFGFQVKTSLPYQEAMIAVEKALKEEGFGILTEIDVKTTLKSKLDKDFRPYAILGACNPPLAHRALSAEPEIGLLLPCNVTLEADEDGGSIIRLLDPNIMMKMGDLENNKDLVEVAEEAHERIKRVANALEKLIEKP
jgi:uncharacterized protein (DUF302 family)